MGLGRNLFRLVYSVIVIGSAGAVVAMDYPVITVETDQGTLDSPVRLDDLSVSVLSEEGATTSLVTFASLGKPTAGTLRKRGTGFVMSSSSMTNFTGTVLIEEGAMCAEGPGAFGPANKTAGAMVISNGATLVLAGRKATMAGYGMNIWNPITVEGSGVNGIGAIYNKTIEVTSREALKGGLTLTGDTLIGSASSYEIGDKGGTTPTYQMNGHTLTLSNGSGILVNSAVFDSGNIVVTNKSLFRVQSGLTFQGGATNRLTVHAGSMFAAYNGGTFAAPWSLVLENGAKLQPSGNKTSNQIKTLARHNWKGPVLLNGQVDYTSNDNAGFEGFSFWGPVTGEGGFKITRGYLNLTNDLNDFRGPVSVRATDPKYWASLGLWASNTWPQANVNPLVMTNASLYFGKKTNYNLPQIKWHNQTTYTNSCMFGEPDYLVSPGLVKTGNGVLEVPGVFTATGRTELIEGTLRLTAPRQEQYSLAPGLWESVTKWGTNNPGTTAKSDYYTNGTLADTNGVTTAPVLCQATGSASWNKYQVARYEGYVWNRSSETQRWSLAMATILGRLYLDDALVLKQENTWYWLATNTISVAPGPHKFDIRFWNSGYAEGGGKDCYYIANGLTGTKMTYVDPVGGTNLDEKLPERWPKRFGFGIDVKGRSSLYSSDYEKPSNGVSRIAGGDGVWFTRTANSCEQILSEGGLVAEHYRSAFETLALYPAATLDMGGVDVYANQLEGCAQLTNGTLRVKNSWTLDAVAATAGAKLAASDDVRVVFADGALLALDEIAAWGLRGVSVPVLSAGTIEGVPTVSADLAAAHATCTKSADGKSLYLHIPPRGLGLYFR